jgi:hypothetical protein
MARSRARLRARAPRARAGLLPRRRPAPAAPGAGRGRDPQAALVALLRSRHRGAAPLHHHRPVLGHLFHRHRGLKLCRRPAMGLLRGRPLPAAPDPGPPRLHPDDQGDPETHRVGRAPTTPNRLRAGSTSRTRPTARRSSRRCRAAFRGSSRWTPRATRWPARTPSPRWSRPGTCTCRGRPTPTAATAIAQSPRTGCRP